MKLATNEEIINSLFATGAVLYNWRLPEGSKNFYEHKKDSLINDSNLQQEILAPLIQNLAEIRDDSNPLKMFLQQGMSFREAQGASAFDTLKGEHLISVKRGESVDQLEVNNPEIEAPYISDKRKDNSYEVIMTSEQIERAFREKHGLYNLLDEIRSRFIEIDKAKSYTWLERLIDCALNSKVAPLQKTQEIYIPDIRDFHLDEKSYNLAIRIIQKAVECLSVHSRLHNACYFKKACSSRDLSFIFDINTQVLDEVMNMSTVCDAKNSLLKVKNFGEKNSDVIGLAMSKQAISIHDLERIGNCTFDPSSLEMKIFFHIRQSSLFSPFETMIVFKAGTDNQINKTIEMYEDVNRKKLEKEAEEKALKRVKVL
ncbi:hypothetical protein [Bartonella massiliensis]|uniref:hypothetical protein n=1 Tax=Bartonella massiliensis TaxID=929795 RepID=UPI0011571ABE|nr:hypothetical protein [Bartonella massiliensis]